MNIPTNLYQYKYIYIYIYNYTYMTYTNVYTTVFSTSATRFRARTKRATVPISTCSARLSRACTSTCPHR